ncbi:MAG: hypothetical protein HND51_02040 [Chloroflexi bacterium]|nr:hypothetical protein [Chloroflexota bacterium]
MNLHSFFNGFNPISASNSHVESKNQVATISATNQAGMQFDMDVFSQALFIGYLALLRRISKPFVLGSDCAGECEPSVFAQLIARR